MPRWIVALALLVVSVPAQTLEDVLPRGMTLDATGKLQWVEAKPTPCAKCVGRKTVRCPRCGPEPAACGLCSDRKMPCTACGGTGSALDPFVDVVCTLCRGTRKSLCPSCSGKKSLTTPSGVEKACGGCKGNGAFLCPLCAGKGTLAGVRIAGKDVRTAPRKQVEELAERLEALSADLENLKLDAAHDAALDQVSRVVASLPKELALPASQRERLAAVVAATPAGDKDDFLARLEITGHLRALAELVHDQLEQARTCAWRLQRNAEGVPAAEEMRASGLSWKSIFGSDPEAPSSGYCLLGRGFLRTPTAKDTEAVIDAWMKKHPAACVRPVARLRGVFRFALDSELVYAWVVDGKENLNLHLVETGCVPAGVMGAPTERIEISVAEYLEFLRAVAAAEVAAKAAKKGYWGEAEVVQESHDAKAKKLMEQGQHELAIPELEAALAAGGADSAYRWLDLAECHERLRRWKEALAVYDKAIGDGRWWPPYVRKAHCLSKAEGLESGVAWLEKLAAAAPEDRKFPHLLGEFLRDSGEPRRAAKHFERAVELASKKHGFRFDADGWLVLDEKTLAKENNDYADLWPTLEYLAECHQVAGPPADALRFATMGVSIGQQLKRCKGYYDATEIEAGDVDCRAIRARVLLDRFQWDAAEKDLRLARALAERSGYSGWKQKLDGLDAELRAGRRK